MRDPFRVGLAQFSPRLGAVDANLQRHLEFIEQARASQVDLLVFPELSLTGYYLRDLVPEVAQGRDSTVLQRLSKAARDLSLIVCFVEETEDHRFHNAAAYIEDGDIRYVHRKVYLPTYGMFDEQRYFDAGDCFRAFPTRFGRMGVLICEDLWHPSSALILAQSRANLLVCPTASPSRGMQTDRLYSAEVYDLACRTYAHFFQVFCFFCNRVGFEDGGNFWGGSLVVTPFGEVSERGPLLEESLVIATIDPDLLRRARIGASFAKDERLDLTIRELRRVSDERDADQH